VPEAEVAEHYSIQSQSREFNSATKQWWVRDSEHPYSTPPDRPYAWMRGYHLGGRSITWGRQTYRMSDCFSSDDREVVAGVLNDLVNTGIAYRAGRGGGAVYRTARAADFRAADGDERDAANDYLVWQAVYRGRPATLEQICAGTGLSEGSVEAACARLLDEGRIQLVVGSADSYTSERLDVPVGQAIGWEAAVFDHFQALVSAVSAKLSAGDGRAEHRDVTGGATYTLDLWPGHPLEAEAKGTLGRTRQALEDLRARIDQVNQASPHPKSEQVVFYLGQYVKDVEPPP
jgi:choline dehydrogenase-like flavoprotein